MNIFSLGIRFFALTAVILLLAPAPLAAQDTGTVVATLDAPVLYFETQAALTTAAQGQPVVLDPSIGAGPFESRAPARGDVWIAVQAVEVPGGRVAVSVHARGSEPLEATVYVAASAPDVALADFFSAVLARVGRSTGVSRLLDDEAASSSAPPVRPSAVQAPPLADGTLAVPSSEPQVETIVDSRTGRLVTRPVNGAAAHPGPIDSTADSFIDARTGRLVTRGTGTGPVSGRSESEVQPTAAVNAHSASPRDERSGTTRFGLRLMSGGTTLGYNAPQLTYGLDGVDERNPYGEILAGNGTELGFGVFGRLSANAYFGVEFGLEYRAQGRQRFGMSSYNAGEMLFWEHTVSAPILPTVRIPNSSVVAPIFTAGLAPGVTMSRTWIRMDSFVGAERFRLDFVTQAGVEFDTRRPFRPGISMRVTRSLGQAWGAVNDWSVTGVVNLGIGGRS